MSEINITPFFIEAIGHNKKTHKHVDRLYQTNKYVFYKYAKDSKWYNHAVVKEGDILREVYSRKALGILLYAYYTKDDATGDAIVDIVKKGWPRVYAFVNSSNKIDIEQYLYKEFMNRNRSDFVDDDINSESFILYWLAQLLGKEIVYNETTDRLAEIMLARFEHYNPENPRRYSYKTFDKNFKKHIRTLEKRVQEHCGGITSLDDIYFNGVQDVKDLSKIIGLLFDTECQSLSSMFNNIKMKDADIDEILGLHYMVYQNKNATEATKLLVWAFVMKGILKAYRQAKDYYYHNNKETLFGEMEKQDQTINQISVENRALQTQVESLKAEVDQLKIDAEKKYIERIVELEREVNQLQNNLKQEQKKNVELNALREFFFRLDNKEVYELSTNNIDLSSVSGVIVGGHERWQQRMKENLPHFKFINSENFDVQLLNNAEYVFVCANYLGHSLYYKVINEVRKHDIEIGYISHNNDKLALEEMKNIITG